jgi:exopolysaccharide production protein ExoZ
MGYPKQNMEHPEAVAAPAKALRFGGLEAARGVAALLVVLVHGSHILANPKTWGRVPFTQLFEFGHCGVDFFFVLSGFVILYAHLNDLNRPRRLGKYFERRLTRIYPVYWVAFAIIVVLFLASGERYGFAHVLSSVALFPYAERPVLSLAWSLEHEMIYYFLFATLIISVRAGLAVFAAWGVSIVIVVSQGAHVWGNFGVTLFSVFNLNFFLGMGAALVVLKRVIRRWQLVLTAGLAIFGSMIVIEVLRIVDGHLTPARLVYATGGTLIIIGLAEAERAGKLPIPRLFMVMGTASYSIYLMHVQILLVLQELAYYSRLYRVLPVEVAFLIFVPLAVFGAILFSRWCEFPLLELTRRLTRKRVPLPVKPRSREAAVS